MNLPAHHLALFIVLHVFRHQMATIAGGVQAHILRRQFQGAFQHTFQMLVLMFSVLERQVIAVDDKALTAFADIINDIRQILQVVLVHLDHPQPPRRKLVQQRLDDGGLAGAPAAPQQHMVAGFAAQKPFRVLQDLRLLGIDAEQILQPYRIRSAHRSQGAGTAPPDRGRNVAPVDIGRHGSLVRKSGKAMTPPGK